MSYVIDLYRKEIKVQKNILNLALYISFFPQLIAGPIVKYKDIEKQLTKRKITVEKFAYGIKRFVYGLGKKVILANNLALIADLIFDSGANTITMPFAWLGIIAYTLQIFFDFSGYSDMAIGLGSMFGFTFSENFNLPYLSSSITEFWRRWHISLSTWFKEYLYIPLGGNRKGKKRTYFNLWMVFLATGIWHGAAWTFVLWGIFHGLFIFIERLGFKNVLDKNKIIGHIYTLFIVMIGWVFFRADSIGEAGSYLATMFGFSNNALTFNPVRIMNIKTPIIIIVSILLCGILQSIVKKICENRKYEKRYEAAKKYVEPVLLLSIIGMSFLILISNTYNPFIYFRF
jgi:alginate O-acetyltransferase complex protein AlgI